MPKKYYIFDFDGTLANSLPYWKKAMTEVLKNNGIKSNKKIIKTIIPLSVEKTAEYFMLLGINKSKNEILQDIYLELKKIYTYNILLKPKVYKTLKELYEKGEKLYILSSAPYEFLEVCLKRNGIFNLFSFIWSSRDFEYGKTQKELYLLIAEKLKQSLNKKICNSDIYFFDDDLKVITAAKQAGFTVFGIYDKTNAKNKKEIKNVCGYYLKSLKQIKKL